MTTNNVGHVFSALLHLNGQALQDSPFHALSQNSRITWTVHSIAPAQYECNTLYTCHTTVWDGTFTDNGIGMMTVEHTFTGREIVALTKARRR